MAITNLEIIITSSAPHLPTDYRFACIVAADSELAQRLIDAASRVLNDYSTLPGLGALATGELLPNADDFDDPWEADDVPGREETLAMVELYDDTPDTIMSIELHKTTQPVDTVILDFHLIDDALAFAFANADAVRA